MLRRGVEMIRLLMASAPDVIEDHTLRSVAVCSGLRRSGSGGLELWIETYQKSKSDFSDPSEVIKDHSLRSVAVRAPKRQVRILALPRVVTQSGGRFQLVNSRA